MGGGCRLLASWVCGVGVPALNVSPRSPPHGPQEAQGAPCPVSRSPRAHGDRTSGGSLHDKLLFLSLPLNKGGFVILEPIYCFITCGPLVHPTTQSREETGGDPKELKRRNDGKMIVEQSRNLEASLSFQSSGGMCWRPDPEKDFPCQAEMRVPHPHPHTAPKLSSPILSSPDGIFSRAGRMREALP